MSLYFSPEGVDTSSTAPSELSHRESHRTSPSAKAGLQGQQRPEAADGQQISSHEASLVNHYNNQSSTTDDWFLHLKMAEI